MKNTESVTMYTCDQCATEVVSNTMPDRWAEVTYNRNTFDSLRNSFHLCVTCADSMQLLFSMELSISAQADLELADDAASIADVPDLDEDLFDFPAGRRGDGS